MGLALLRCLGAVVLIAACGLLPGGISRDRAIEIAFEHADLRSAVLFNAYDDDVGAEGAQRRAWVVTIRGDSFSCDGPGIPGEPGSEPCRWLDGEAVMYIDQETGAVLSSILTTTRE